MINSPSHLCFIQELTGSLEKPHSQCESVFKIKSACLSQTWGYNQLHPAALHTFHPEFQCIFLLPPWPGNWWLRRVLDSCHETFGYHSRLVSDYLQSSSVRVKNCGSPLIDFIFVISPRSGIKTTRLCFTKRPDAFYGRSRRVTDAYLTVFFLTHWNCVKKSDVCIGLSIVQSRHLLFTRNELMISARHGRIWKCHVVINLAKIIAVHAIIPIIIKYAWNF